MGDLDEAQSIQRQVVMEDGRCGSGSRRRYSYVEKMQCGWTDLVKLLLLSLEYC